MDPQIQSLRFWHDLITIDALLLGAEGPVLLWIGTFLDRPRRERVLALVPALAFGWGAWSAKLINDALVHAASLIAWSHANYPTFPVSVDTAPAVASATRTGWIFGVVTALLLIGGWALVLRWSRGKGLPAWGEVFPRRPRASQAALHLPAPASTPVTGALDDDTDEGIEITIERMEP